MSTELTTSQRDVLTYAAENTDGKIVWYPFSIKGGARQKVMNALTARGLIVAAGAEWFVSPEGYKSIGIDPEVEAAVAQVEASATKVRRGRDNTKQATVIAMLKRAEGATIAQVCEVTGWQSHTVRGTFAGAFKKKLGLNLVSEKAQGGERVYRIG